MLQLPARPTHPRDLQSYTPSTSHRREINSLTLLGATRWGKRSTSHTPITAFLGFSLSNLKSRYWSLQSHFVNCQGEVGDKGALHRPVVMKNTLILTYFPHCFLKKKRIQVLFESLIINALQLQLLLIAPLTQPWLFKGVVLRYDLPQGAWKTCCFCSKDACCEEVGNGGSGGGGVCTSVTRVILGCYNMGETRANGRGLLTLYFTPGVLAAPFPFVKKAVQPR